MKTKQIGPPKLYNCIPPFFRRKNTPTMQPIRKLFNSLFRNRDLVIQMTKRQLIAEHRGSLLGSLWLIFQPLLLMLVYTFVFSTIYDGKYGVIEGETNIQYAIGIFIGISVLHMFTDSLAGTFQCVRTNPSYVKKVVFPIEILPLTAVLVNLYKFTTSIILILLGVYFLVGNFQTTTLWLPATMLPTIILSVGIAWIVSALGVFLRDIGPLIQIVSLCMLWLSGVFYSARAIPQSAWEFLKYNPILLNIEMTRDALLWGTPPNSVWLAYSYGIAFFVFFLGYFFFTKLKYAFADVL